MTFRSPLVIALDVPTLSDAQALCERVRAHVCMAKVGLELFTAVGPEAVRSLASLPIFLDLKLHDIPETVDRAVARVAELGARMLTVHASGGAAMLERAVKRASKEATGLEIVAVTVLTSVDHSDGLALGWTEGPSEHVARLTRLAVASGVTAFVCSPREVAAVRRVAGAAATLVVPGIRPPGVSAGDQKRVGPPAETLRLGADLLVVGRPIRDASDPGAAAAAIVRDLVGADLS